MPLNKSHVFIMQVQLVRSVHVNLTSNKYEMGQTDADPPRASSSKLDIHKPIISHSQCLMTPGLLTALTLLYSSKAAVRIY